MRNLLLIALLLCASVGVTYAQTAIPLVNPSFEDPSVAPERYVYGQLPTGWGITKTINGHQMLVTDPVALFGSISPLPNHPDGAQIVAVWSDSNMDEIIYQNTGVQLHAGITYTVSAYAGGGLAALIGVACSDTPTGPLNTDIPFVFGSSPEEVIYTLSWDWEQSSMSGTMTTGAPQIGKYLCVYLRAHGWVGFDNVTLTALDLGYADISGTITLGDFKGDLTLCPIKIELLEAGTATVLATQDVRPAAGATNPIPYTLEAVVPGTYDIRFSASKWLPKTLTSVVMGSTNKTGFNVTLLNGDIDGSSQIDADVEIPMKNIDQKGD